MSRLSEDSETMLSKWCTEGNSCKQFFRMNSLHFEYIEKVDSVLPSEKKETKNKCRKNKECIYKLMY